MLFYLIYIYIHTHTHTHTHTHKPNIKQEFYHLLWKREKLNKYILDCI